MRSVPGPKSCNITLNGHFTSPSKDRHQVMQKKEILGNRGLRCSVTGTVESKQGLAS